MIHLKTKDQVESFVLNINMSFFMRWRVWESATKIMKEKTQKKNADPFDLAVVLAVCKHTIADDAHSPAACSLEW